MPDDVRRKISESQLGVPKPSTTLYNKTRESIAGWHHTEDSKKKIGEGVSGKKNGMYGKKAKFNKYTNYINEEVIIKMRSTWEVKFAQWLDENNKSWTYEKHTFPLSNESTYTPDFYSDGVFYEIKGYPHKGSMNKLELFMNEYNDKKIILVNREFLENNNII